MPRHINISKGTLYAQPGFSLSVDREGKWSATQVFQCHRESVTALLPRPGTVHPEVPFIAVDGVNATITEGDLAEITVHYAGAEPREPENEKANATYSMALSLSEEPLLTHHRYSTLSSAEKQALNQIMGGKDKDDQGKALRDKVTSERGKEALAKIDRGQTSYYSPRVAWRESWVRDHPAAAAELNKTGQVDTPNGPVPPLAAGRNWLRNGATQTQEGASFRIEVEWLASDRGGWDPDLYTD
jgi:hypothetical protein